MCSHPCESHVDSRCCPFFRQDAPVQAQVQQALARPRMAHALRPSAASSQRIVGDLRSTKWSTRREERYRIICSHRTGLPSLAEQQNPQTDTPEGAKEKVKCWGLGEVQVVDLLHENVEEQDKSSGKVSMGGGKTNTLSRRGLQSK